MDRAEKVTKLKVLHKRFGSSVQCQLWIDGTLAAQTLQVLIEHCCQQRQCTRPNIALGPTRLHLPFFVGRVGCVSKSMKKANFLISSVQPSQSTTTNKPEHGHHFLHVFIKSPPKPGTQQLAAWSICFFSPTDVGVYISRRERTRLLSRQSAAGSVHRQDSTCPNPPMPQSAMCPRYP